MRQSTREAFRAVEQHVRGLAGVEVDQACKDPARLCFLSYDPELYHNPGATEIELTETTLDTVRRTGFRATHSRAAPA
jgi:BT4734-like, N-terminal domain